MPDAEALQRSYYAATADRYEEMHVAEGDAHTFSLGVLSGFCARTGMRSVLDIGSGTGRGVAALRASHPDMVVIGVEPSPELRAIGHAKGIQAHELVDGNAMALPYADGEFDVVCEFGALHHIPDPSKAVSEMLRVGRRAIFISDSNNFGGGAFRPD